MKRNLGSLLLVCMQFLLLQAEDFTYALKASNPHPYLKEGILLTLDVNQTNHDVVLLFDFDINPSNQYTFQRVDVKELNAHHDLQIRYTYLLYPLENNDINVTFSLTKKVTNDDLVAYSFSGDRDNVKGLSTTDHNITLPPLTLSVKRLPKRTQLVGDFHLDYTVKKHKANAYESLPLKVILKGKGYPPVLDTLFPEDANYTLFKEKPLVESVFTRQGTQSTVTYPMALSSAKSFTLPTIAIKAFNPKTARSYKLTLPSQKFDITPVAKEKLVDKIDTPPPLTIDWTWLTTLLEYIVVFAAGFLSAIVLKITKRTKAKRMDPLITKIEMSKDAKSLLQLLMAQDSYRFRESIEKLEDTLYQDAKIDLGKLKKEIMESLV